jgi:hypothetical protein
MIRRETMEPIPLARPSRAFLAVLLLAFAGAALAVCRAYVWRWSDAEAAARSFAAAALAGDGAALARLGTAEAPAAELLALRPDEARGCVGWLRFVEGRERAEGEVLLLFDGPEDCPLGHRPALFMMQRAGGGWRVREVYFFPFPRRGRVAAIDIPIA